MINVAIVEDEWDSQEKLKISLFRYAEESGVQFNVTRFSSGIDIVSDYNPIFSIIFMDVDMPDMDGFETAKRIRAVDQEVVIVFVTFLGKYAIKGYSVGAMDYVLKPFTYFSIKPVIMRAVKLSRKNAEEEVILPLRDGVLKTNLSCIAYVEISGHDIIYHTDKGNYSAYGTMKSVEKQLPSDRFVRCNSCYLVNLSCVTRVEDNFVHVGGDKLAVSRPKKKSFMEALHTTIN